MRQIHDDASSSRLVSTARIEPHARHRTAVGKTPLNEDVTTQVNVTNYTSHACHLSDGGLTHFNKLVADDKGTSIEAGQTE